MWDKLELLTIMCFWKGFVRDTITKMTPGSKDIGLRIISTMLSHDLNYTGSQGKNLIHELNHIPAY